MDKKGKMPKSDTIIISLHRHWWKKILAGEKLLEIRKNKPAENGSYRVLVYITGTGEIKGEFICNKFYKIRTIPEVQIREGLLEINVLEKSCLTRQKLQEYAGESLKPLWGWAIAGVKEYHMPHSITLYGLKRPPQSWQYYRGEKVPEISDNITLE